AHFRQRRREVEILLDDHNGRNSAVGHYRGAAARMHVPRRRCDRSRAQPIRSNKFRCPIVAPLTRPGPADAAELVLVFSDCRWSPTPAMRATAAGDLFGEWQFAQVRMPLTR